jgi:hypothetical protein
MRPGARVSSAKGQRAHPYQPTLGQVRLYSIQIISIYMWCTYTWQAESGQLAQSQLATWISRLMKTRPMTFPLIDISPHWHFARRTFHPHGISPHVHFALRTFLRTFLPKDILPHGHFAPRIFRLTDISPTDIFPHRYFTPPWWFGPRTFRPIDIVILLSCHIMYSLIWLIFVL